MRRTLGAVWMTAVVVCVALLSLVSVGRSAPGARAISNASTRGAGSSAPNTLTRGAKQDFAAGRFAAAASRLDELLKRDLSPADRADAYVLLCETRLRLGEFVLAESLAARAKTTGRITDESALQHLSFLRAEILYFSGDAKRASEEYITFLEDNLEGPFVNDAVERLLLIDENTGPDSRPLAAYARAELAELTGAPDTAIAILDSILDSRPLPPIADEALARKADVLRGLRRFADAVDQYRLVETRFPDSRLVPRCKLKMAELYSSELGEREKAIAECEEIAKSFPGTTYAVDARALLSALSSDAKGRK